MVDLLVRYKLHYEDKKELFIYGSCYMVISVLFYSWPDLIFNDSEYALEENKNMP